MDPLRDFEIHDAEQAEWLASRPICDICGEPIQDETYHKVLDHCICDECLEEMKVYSD